MIRSLQVKPEPLQMLVFRLDAWGVTPAVLRDFQWERRDNCPNKTVIDFMCYRAKQIGTLLIAARTWDEVTTNPDPQSYEDWRRERFPMLSDEAAQAFIEVAEICERNDSHFTADNQEEFDALVETSNHAWQSCNMKELWPAVESVVTFEEPEEMAA